MAVQHEIKVRDLRLRYGAPEVYAAQCSCGWIGEERRGRTGERNAQWDGRHHVDHEHHVDHHVDHEHHKPRRRPRA
jgi:hypothetical protein